MVTDARDAWRYDTSGIKYLPHPTEKTQKKLFQVVAGDSSYCPWYPRAQYICLDLTSQPLFRQSARASHTPSISERTSVSHLSSFEPTPPTMAFVTASFALSANAAPTAAVSSFRGARVAGARRARPAALTMNLDTIQQKIAEEMAKAAAATEKHGKTSKEAALAWDIVEELEAEASHMKANQKSQDPLDKYCEDSPEADEVCP